MRSIALRAPRDLAALQALDVMPPGTAQKLWPEIGALLEAAAREPLDGYVQVIEARPSEEEQAAAKRLTNCLKTVAASLELVPEVLGTQRDLRRIARGEPPSQVLTGWRADVLVEPLTLSLG